MKLRPRIKALRWRVKRWHLTPWFSETWITPPIWWFSEGLLPDARNSFKKEEKEVLGGILRHQLKRVCISTRRRIQEANWLQGSLKDRKQVFSWRIHASSQCNSRRALRIQIQWEGSSEGAPRTWKRKKGGTKEILFEKWVGGYRPARFHLDAG